MELAISSWSFHTLFLNNLMTPHTFPGVARERFGIRAVEFFEGDFCDDVRNVDEAYVSEIAEACKAAGVSVCCIAARNDLTAEDSEAAECDVERLQRWVQYAPLLGCRIIRVNTGLLRPTRDSLGRARGRLASLLEAASQREVVFAVENHPHVVRNELDLNLIMEFVESFADERVRTCPDMGSFSDEYRREGFARMSRCAAHVHTKAPLGCEDRDDLVTEYRPFIEILKDYGYTGFLSIESIEVVDARADPLVEAWHAARAIGAIIGQTVADRPPSLDLVVPKHARTDGAPRIPQIPQQEVEIAERVLPLVLEGCEHRLGAPTWMHTFPADKDYSPLPGHAPEPGCSARRTFCGVVARDGSAKIHCDKFYQDQYRRIREHGVLRRQVCFCPLGLAVLFVPIEKAGSLYGTLACGGWRESGTEGVILYGLGRCVSSAEIRGELERSLLETPELTSGGLLQARETLQGVAQDLAEFYHLAYHDQLVRRQDQLIRDLLDATRGPEFRSLDSAAAAFGPVLNKVVDFLQAEYLFVYMAETFDDDSQLDLEKLTGTAGPLACLPDDFPIDSDLIQGQNLFSDKDTLAVLSKFLSPPPKFYYEFDLTQSKTCVIVCGGLSSHPDADTPIPLLERVSREISYVLRNANRLDEAVQGQERLRTIADQTRHQLNAPLQGIRGALGRLRSLLKEDGTRGQMESAAMRADVFAQEAGTIVETLSRSSMDARVLGRREAPKFRKAHVGPIIRKAARPFKLAARERGIDIKIAKSVYDLPSLECDGTQIEILFANLIDNAVKYSHAHRPIDIRGETVRLQSADGKKIVDAVKITVRDFGLGIPTEDIEENIFKPYFQSSVPDETRPIGGTGIGLSVCREITEQHGGKISASCLARKGFALVPPSISERQLLQGCVVEMTVFLPLSQAGRLQ